MDDFVEDFEFVDIEPEESDGNSFLRVLHPPSRDPSAPGSETPSSLTFPALVPNVNALIPTQKDRSKTPRLDTTLLTATSGEDSARFKRARRPLPIRKAMSIDNKQQDATQKENEPPQPDSKTIDLPLVNTNNAPEPTFFDGCTDVYSCKVCGMHVAREIEIESKSFQVGEGPFTEAKRGYLFRSAVNLRQGPPQPEHFTTGIYTISYVDCFGCGSQFGWKYLGAEKPAGRAKINKFCLKCVLLERLDP